MYLLYHIRKKCELQVQSTIILASIFTYIVTFTNVLYFSLQLWVTVWYPCISAWRTPFSISCREGLLLINSLSFCLAGNILISPSFLKDSLADVEFLVDSFLCFLFFFQDFIYFIPLPSGIRGF